MKVFGKDAGSIRVRTGESFVLEYEGKPSAGYMWKVTGAGPGVRLQELPADRGPGIGASARQRFQVDAVEAGEHQVSLEYGRSWEQNPQERRTVTIQVDE